MMWIWNFYIYSFLGFLLEVLYARVTGAVKQDRKCHLFLPLCPVYGLGAIAIAALPAYITDRPMLLLIAGGLTATLVEYLTAVFYEKIWRVSFWDYSRLPGHLHGRICLPFAAIWGVLSLGLVYLLHPRLEAVTSLLPPQLLFPVTLLFVVDFAVTGRVLRREKSTEILRWYRE